MICVTSAPGFLFQGKRGPYPFQESLRKSNKALWPEIISLIIFHTLLLTNLQTFLKGQKLLNP